ncbi:MAG: lysophospholipase [Oscillospiraceae bacterium]|jgi:pimeloyl-ACP methyl ester carboxylesterase|nr:lysophospholipase [Oscillospiraceae bacterium]
MKIKRMLALVLCAALLMGALALPAAANETSAQTCTCGEVVQVYMDGFGMPLYYDFGTPEQRDPGMAVTDNLFPAILRLLWGAAKTAFTFSWNPLADGIGALLFSLMGHLRVAPDGTSVEPLTNHWVLNPAQDHRNRPQYTFNYDFRMDPFFLAAELEAFIEALCETTGHAKVALTGNSEGAIVVMTYLAEYGTERLDSLILVNGAFQGLTLVGELFTKQIALSQPAVTNYIATLDGGSGGLATAMEVLRAAHVLDLAAPLLGGFVMRTMSDRLFETTIVPIFVAMPVLWAFVPTAYYPQARTLISGRPEYAKLLAQADLYHEKVQSQAEDLLKNAAKKGVKVALMCSYGRYPIPVTKNSYYQCDGLIDTALESGGATAAPIGKTLLPSTSKYRSPDGIFDAATCMLPDQTWFVANNGHESGPTNELRQWIIHSEAQPTVWQNEDYPQYLVQQDGNAVPYVF